MSTPLEAFFPWVVPSVPGAPDPLVLQALRDAADTFCRRTNLVQRVITADMVAGEPDYDVTPPTGMTLLQVMSVSVEGRTQATATPGAVTYGPDLAGAPSGAAEPSTGEPRVVFQKTPTVTGFSLTPTPDRTVSGALVIKASFGVAPDAAEVETDLFTHWRQVIAAGAIGALLELPGRSFSNALLADRFTRKFAAGLSSPARQARGGSMASEQRVQPVPFA